MKKSSAIAALVLLIAMGAARYWRPSLWTIQDMKIAVETGDPDKLIRYINFPAV